MDIVPGDHPGCQGQRRYQNWPRYRATKHAESTDEGTQTYTQNRQLDTSSSGGDGGIELPFRRIYAWASTCSEKGAPGDRSIHAPPPSLDIHSVDVSRETIRPRTGTAPNGAHSLEPQWDPPRTQRRRLCLSHRQRAYASLQARQSPAAGPSFTLPSPTHPITAPAPHSTARPTGGPNAPTRPESGTLDLYG